MKIPKGATAYAIGPKNCPMHHERLQIKRIYPKKIKDEIKSVAILQCPQGCILEMEAQQLQD